VQTVEMQVGYGRQMIDDGDTSVVAGAQVQGRGHVGAVVGLTPHPPAGQIEPGPAGLQRHGELRVTAEVGV
jgi:hypothetical protein